MNTWNSLLNWVVSANTTNTFKARLDKFWHNQNIIYNFRAQLQGTGSRSECLHEESFILRTLASNQIVNWLNEAGIEALACGRKLRLRLQNSFAWNRSVWTMHRPYWPHRLHTVCMAVLYTKQGPSNCPKMQLQYFIFNEEFTTCDTWVA